MSRNEIAKELENRICSHITRNDIESLRVLRSYHMEEVRCIRDYMMNLVGDSLHDARALNRCFHMALADLQINVADLFLPKTTKKQTSYKVAI